MNIHIHHCFLQLIYDLNVLFYTYMIINVVNRKDIIKFNAIKNEQLVELDDNYC